MQAAHRFHHHADVGVADDEGKVVCHCVAQRMRVKAAQIQHAPDAQRFAAEAACYVQAVACDYLVHAVADGAEAEYSDIDHRFVHTFLCSLRPRFAAGGGRFAHKSAGVAAGPCIVRKADGAYHS